MAVISNSPRELSIIEAEARKSFALTVLLTDARDRPVDLTGYEFRFVAVKLDRLGNHTFVIEKDGVVLDAHAGVLRVDLQAADLELLPDEYPFSLTAVYGGYSSVVLKGHLKIQQNTEYASVGETYATAQPPQNLGVMLRQQGDIHVEVGHLLPADLMRIPGGGTTGQVLGKPNNDPLSVAWLDMQGGISATGVPEGWSPRALGDGTWEWQKTLGEAEMQLIQDALTTAGGLILTLQQTAADHDTRITAAQNDASYAIDLGNWALGVANNAAEEAKRRGPAGSITLYAGASAPTGWVICDGRSLSRASYPTLFAAIGTTYGSVDANSFNIPDLRGLLPVGLNPVETEFNELGKTGGAKTHTITTAQLPALTASSAGAHTHTGTTGSAGSHSHNQRFNTGAIAAGGGSNVAGMSGSGGNSSGVAEQTTQSAGAHTHSFTTASGGAHTHTVVSGSAEAHNILPPYMTLNYIIRT